jgi:hypothetical protein
VNRIRLTQDRDQLLAVVNTVIKGVDSLDKLSDC